MTRLDGSVEVAASQADIWAVLGDVDALSRVLPGARSIVATGPGRFSGELASRIQFVTVVADVEASLEDAIPLEYVRLELSGRPHGLAGSFAASIPFDLVPIEGTDGQRSRTRIRYTINVRVTGRLAAFGAPLLRDSIRRQIAALVANLDGELQTKPRRPSG